MNDITIERILELRLEYAKNKVAQANEWELAEQSGSFDTSAVRNRAVARTVRSEDIVEQLEKLKLSGFDVELVEADSESGGCHIYAPVSYSEALEEIFTLLNLDGGVYTADEPYPYGIYNWPSAKRYVDAHVR